jgi:hypothetical protein
VKGIIDRAVIVVVTVILTATVPSMLPQRNVQVELVEKEAQIEVVDVIARDGENPSISITMKNNGDRVAVLTKTEIHVEAIYGLQPCMAYEHFPLFPTAIYHATLPENANESVFIETRHEIDADKPDIYDINLKAPESLGLYNGFYNIYTVQVTLIYNEQKTEKTQTIALPFHRVGATYDLSPDSCDSIDTFLLDSKYYAPQIFESPNFDESSRYITSEELKSAVLEDNRRIISEVADSSEVTTDEIKSLIKAYLS